MQPEDTKAPAPIVDADPGLAGWEDPLASLRRALDQNELQVFCQPIMSLQPGVEKYPMAEILVRLREEEESLLPPGDFLPVFEHYRMMTDLDCWVVDRTVEWMAKAAAGSIPAYSINVSSQSLDDSRLVDCTSKALSRSGVDPARLSMEIDENDVLVREKAAAGFARAVRGIGCKVIIDGFARRSVSFVALKDLQPNYVKVDGSVVRKIGESSVAQLKLKAIARVCGVAGIGMIAECVEEERIVAQLTKMSVGFAQGFGIAVPRPIALGGMSPT
jgi:EAL domain-containing protein (putative c-di-GMP-specific phosphodiesterase class I)